VTAHVAAPDGDEAEDDGVDHGGAEHEAKGGEQIADVVSARIEEREPQTGEAREQTGRDDEPPGGAVPAGPAAPEAGGELERAQDGEDGGADDVEHDRQRHRGARLAHRHDVSHPRQRHEAQRAGDEGWGGERHQRHRHPPPTVGPRCLASGAHC
jgi:hypothetical protein